MHRFPTRPPRKLCTPSSPGYLVISEQGLKAKSEHKDGKNIWWTTDINAEIPLKIRRGTGPASVSPVTIPECLLRNVRESPTKPVMQIERNNVWVKWNWARFYNDAINFAKALLTLGIQERRCVNIIGANTPEWVIAFTGTILANNVASGVYPTNKPEACLDIADLAKPLVVVVEDRIQLAKYEAILDKLSEVKAFVIYDDTLPDRFKKNSRFYEWNQFLLISKVSHPRGVGKLLKQRMAKQRPGECCELIFTSGTTGKPKGVMISHDCLLWKINSLNGCINPPMANDNLVVVSYLPLSHVAAQETEIVPMFTQKALIAFAPKDAIQGSLFRTLRQIRPTYFFAVPRVWEKIETRLRNMEAQQSFFTKKLWDWAKGIGRKSTKNFMTGRPPPYFESLARLLVFKRVRTTLGLDRSMACYFGAAPIKKATLQYFASLGLPLINTYGMSELAGLHFTCYNRPHWCKFGPAGPPIRDTAAKIVGGKEGEICMRGRNQFMGYLNNEAKTKQTIDSQGFVHSGDLGYADQDGYYYVTGRIKQLIITSGGENVAPVPVEHKLKELCPIISNVMLVGEQQKFISSLMTLKCQGDLLSGKTTGKLQPEAIKALRSAGVLKPSDEDLSAQAALTHPGVLEWVDRTVKEVNQHYVVSRACQVRKWRLIPGDFSVAGGHLTPSMKLRRSVVAEIYKQEIADFYAGPKPKL